MLPDLQTPVMKHSSFANHAGVLAHIYENGINLAAHEAEVDTDIESFVRREVLTSTPLSIQATIEAPAALPSLLPDHLRQHPDAHGWLSSLERIATLWFELFGVTAAGVRITTLDRAMCPRFHVDRVPVRLIVTWGGPGTQWLDNHSVDRGWLGKPLPAGQEDPLAEAEPVHSLPTQAVALFKGELWPDNTGNGIVHRSPPLTPGERRVLLTLDML